MVIPELTHAPQPNVVEGLCLSDTKPTQAPLGLDVDHNNRMDRMATYVWKQKCLVGMGWTPPGGGRGGGLYANQTLLFPQNVGKQSSVRTHHRKICPFQIKFM